MEQKLWWAWPVLGGAGLVIVMTTYRAFSHPWIWNEEQCLFGFFCLCTAYVAVIYARIFARGGLEGVRAHWGRVKQMEDPRLNASVHRRNPIYWITIAGIIVFSVLTVPETRQYLSGLFH